MNAPLPGCTPSSFFIVWLGACDTSRSGQNQRRGFGGSKVAFSFEFLPRSEMFQGRVPGDARGSSAGSGFF